jgi:hypothetical protein
MLMCVLSVRLSMSSMFEAHGRQASVAIVTVVVPTDSTVIRYSASMVSYMNRGIPAVSVLPSVSC